MSLELRPVGKDTWRPISRLSRTLTWEQSKFVAHNAASMLEAIYDPEHLTVRGVYLDDEPIGLVMWADIRDEEPNAYYIVRLMVAGPHQRKGYGRAIMQQVISLLKQAPECEKLYISFDPANDAARSLYASLGFEDTGRLEDDEVVYLLRMKQDQESQTLRDGA
jgi:diamine N-acetyltransferase